MPTGKVRIKLDAVAASAVEVARAAADEVAVQGQVGDHLGVLADAERLVTHHFACTSPAYVGWRWAVTLARAPRSKVATVCEVDLIASDASVVAPQWLPWSDRLAPGDIGAGDVLPKIVDDPRLEQGFEATGEQDVDQAAQWELGLGRVRVLSRQGRGEAGQRWESGEYGPEAAAARAAQCTCSSCGFITPISGVLRQSFAVCTNEWSPADGRVVSLSYGCGAHSESDEVKHDESPPPPVVDDQVVDLVVLPAGPGDQVNDTSVGAQASTATQSRLGTGWPHDWAGSVTSSLGTGMVRSQV